MLSYYHSFVPKLCTSTNSTCKFQINIGAKKVYIFICKYTQACCICPRLVTKIQNYVIKTLCVSIFRPNKKLLDIFVQLLLIRKYRKCIDAASSVDFSFWILAFPHPADAELHLPFCLWSTFTVSNVLFLLISCSLPLSSFFLLYKYCFPIPF